MNPPRILIVDDDAELQGLIVRLLAQEGWAVESALTIKDGERLLAQHRPAVVLLDVMLADGNGLDMCRQWRAQQPDLGILMVSARGDPMDRVLGLEVGADDYLAKPFEKRELVARVRALLRRHRPSEVAPAAAPLTAMVFDGLVIDLIRRSAVVDGKVVELSAIEYRLLLALAGAPGQPQSRDALSTAAQVGGYRPLDRTVDVQVSRLRRKLSCASPGREWIDTVRSEGYVFSPSGAALWSTAAIDVLPAP
jgi:two-component system phosphate regulon response regulator OmpR